jgi:hypothetical protein
MEGDHPVESGKKHVIISFALGFLSCAVIVYVWQAVSIEESTMRYDILNGRLKIKLAGKLKEDKKASEELAELLSERWECTRVVTGMEEDARSCDAMMDSWDKMYNETYLETLAGLARFAIEHRDTTAGLTAKLVYTDLVPYLTGSGDLTEKDYRRSANCDLLLNEIISQHPKTWQASFAVVTLARYMQERNKEDYKEKIRFLKENLKKEFSAPPTQDDHQFKALDRWLALRSPVKAQMLLSLAACQYKLGTLGAKTDAFWLSEARDKYEKLINQYPGYCQSIGGKKNKIAKIDKMLVEAKTQK